MQTKKTLPEEILTAATAILQPYYPDISPKTLIEALAQYNECRTPQEKYYTRREVAELFCVYVVTIDNWILDGLLQAYKVGKRYIRIPASSVEKLLESGKVKID